MKEITTEEKCCKKVTPQQYGFNVGSYKCGKPATHTNGTHFFCRKHSKMGRFVIRDGDVGEIKARFDTEKELRENIINYPGMRMQKVTSSHRKDLY